MSENQSWMCKCGNVSRGPACPQCGRTDESGLDELNMAGEQASSSMRASSLGMGWANGNTSATFTKGCFYAVIAIAIGSIVALLLPLILS